MAWLLCTECSYKTPKQYNLTRHMEKHTKTQKKKEKKREREKEEEKIFECKHCKKSMKDKGILKTHENKQHGYSCSMCDDKFLTKIDLHKHQNIMHGSGTHPQVDQEENVAAEKEAQCRFCQETSERKKESSHKCENLGREFHDFKDAETMIIVDVNQNRNNSFRIHSQTLKLCNYRMKERIQLTKLIKEKIRKIDKRDRKNYDHYAITLAVDEDKTEEEEKDKEDKTEEKDSRKEDKTEDAENIEIKLEPVIENTDPIAVNLEEGQYTLEVCNEIDCKKQAIFVDQGHWTINSITIPDSGIRFKVNKLRRKMKKRTDRARIRIYNSH